MSIETKEKRTFPTNDFYCVSRAIAKGIDIYASILYGFIWSKCGLKNGYCNYSYEHMSAELGISKKTIERRIKLLIDNDLINDISESRYNNPGTTRKYICDESKLKEFKANILKDNVSEPKVKNEVTTSSPKVTTLGLESDDSQSKSDDCQPVKVDLELEVKKDSSERKKQKPENPDTDLLNTEEQEQDQDQERLINELKDWVIKTYDFVLPKYFDDIINELLEGKRKNQKQPIKLIYLQDAWENVYNKIKFRPKPPTDPKIQSLLTGMDRVKYDLRILVDEYPAYEDRRESQKFENERMMKQFKSEQKIDYSKLSPRKTQPAESWIIADFIDEI